jgi:hypothetical protein
MADLELELDVSDYDLDFDLDDFDLYEDVRGARRRR